MGWLAYGICSRDMQCVNAFGLGGMRAHKRSEHGQEEGPYRCCSHCAWKCGWMYRRWAAQPIFWWYFDRWHTFGEAMRGCSFPHGSPLRSHWRLSGFFAINARDRTPSSVLGMHFSEESKILSRRIIVQYPVYSRYAVFLKHNNTTRHVSKWATNEKRVQCRLRRMTADGQDAKSQPSTVLIAMQAAEISRSSGFNRWQQVKWVWYVAQSSRRREF